MSSLVSLELLEQLEKWNQWKDKSGFDDPLFLLYEMNDIDGINFLESHPNMKCWNDMFRTQYMKGIDHSIVFCFDRELKQDQLFTFLDEVYSTLY
jgi:hypothetical protein